VFFPRILVRSLWGGFIPGVSPGGDDCFIFVCFSGGFTFFDEGVGGLRAFPWRRGGPNQGGGGGLCPLDQGGGAAWDCSGSGGGGGAITKGTRVLCRAHGVGGPPRGEGGQEGGGGWAARWEK